MNVKIMIDSASDFTLGQATELGLLFVPISVSFDGEEFLDGVNLFEKEFYEKLESSNTLPQTSLINQYRWEEEFEKATADGSKLVVITLSSKLSGTYQAAVQASKKFKSVYVVDSMNAALGEGLLGLYATQLKKQGLTAEEIFNKLNQKKVDICVYAVIDTLKYLKKGGRISAVSAIVGTTLSIKPLVGLVNGEVKMLGKAMGNKKGNLLLNKMVTDDGGINFDMPWGYIYSGVDKTNIQKYIKDSETITNGKTAQMHGLGATIGTHIGAGAVGLAFFKK